MKKILFYLILASAILLVPGNINSQEIQNSDTAILGAAKRNDITLAKKLISKNANVNARDKNGVSVLMLATYNNDISFVKFLIGKGADIGIKGSFETKSYIVGNALSIAVRNRNADMVYLLLDKCKCEITRKDIIITDKKNPDKGFDLNDFNRKDPNDGVILSYLFGFGLDITLFDLIEFTETEWEVKNYLKFYYDSLEVTDSTGKTLLHAASQNNRLDLAKYLLKTVLYVNIRDNEGQTPWYLAKKGGHKEMMDLLLSNGADTLIIPFEDDEKIEIGNVLSKPAKPELGLPLGHSEVVLSAKFSADGKLIVTGSEDNTAKIWETSTGKLLRSLDKHSAYVKYANFSPDANLVVTQELNYQVKIWDTETGSLLNNLYGSYDAPALFSPDSKSIFFIYYQNSVARFNAVSGRKISEFTGHTADIISFTFNNKFTHLLTASNDSTAKIWDVDSGKLIHSLNGSRGKIEFAGFGDDGKFVLTISSDTIVRLWETASGKMVLQLKGHNSRILNASLSADNQYILTESSDNTAIIWSTSSGNQLFKILQEKIFTNANFLFSPDSKYILTKSNDKAFRVWDVASGRLLDSLNMNLIDVEYLTEEKKIKLITETEIQTREINSWRLIEKVPLSEKIYSYYRRTFSPDNKSLFIFPRGNNITLQLINLSTGNIASEMRRSALPVISADFTISNDSIIFVSESGAKILDFRNGTVSSRFKYFNEPGRGIMSPDKKFIALSGRYLDAFALEEIKTAKRIKYEYTASRITDIAFSPNDKYVANSTTGKSVSIYNCATGEQIKKITEITGGVNSISFNTDGSLFATAALDGKCVIWKTGDFSKFLTFNLPDSTIINHIEFSHNNKYVTTASGDGIARTWDLQSGKLLYEYKTGQEWINSAVFSPDDKYILTYAASTRRESATRVSTTLGENPKRGIISVIDAISGLLITKLDGHISGINDLTFSPDGEKMISVSDDKNAIIWDCNTWKKLFSLQGHLSKINTGKFSSDGKYVLTGSNDARIKVWNPSTGKEILTWIGVDTTDWVVVSPSGLFDASQGAMKMMYYVQGTKVIDLDQIKERYYEPALWSKLMGFNNEPVRDVKGLDEIKIFPEVSLGISNDNLTVKLTDKGGGIGQFMIYINGKEAYTGNAKKDSAIFRGNGNLTSTFNLKNHPYLIPGKENQVTVKAFNGENYLVSRGETILYTPGGVLSGEKPRLFLLTAGVSDYTGDQIDLRFAAKDADDITAALVLGAKRLFGSDETFTYKLTTGMPDRSNWPTKVNIKAAFEKIASKAKSSDIIVVYVSGHGINIGEQDGDFYYLTQDAYTANAEAYKDKTIRDKTTISSTELTDMIKKIPALKQVLIIDACGSGKAVENLIARRDISSSTLRALDRMKDRTGLHIITGCAADAVSYEASRYGQGVLTYSLLEGMKGASLREDKFADVIKLFQYSRERVPELAMGIGGIQQPQTFSPYGEASFDIGEFDAPEKSQIPLAQAKSIVLMSSLKDKETFDDILGMEKLVDEKLREISATNKESSYVFVDARDFPDAFKIRGQYSVSGNNVEVNINIFKGTVKTSSFIVNGIKSDLKKLTGDIVAKLTFK